ncbi:MAG TPA: hypothetical protein ENJ60_01280 [Aeromonadales bacterium]|nr:hypothetical protein [Aeromonadales bacterium]
MISNEDFIFIDNDFFNFPFFVRLINQIKHQPSWGIDMTDKSITIHLNNDSALFASSIKLQIIKNKSLTTAGIMQQVDILEKYSEIRNEVKSILQDFESDTELKQAFSTVFESPELFLKLSQRIEDDLVEYKSRQHLGSIQYQEQI